MTLGLSANVLLTTTRGTQGLDVSRPVPRDLPKECLELALQVPNGLNRNTWRRPCGPAPISSRRRQTASTSRF